MTELFGAGELVDREELFKLLSRLAVNLLFASLVIRGVYQRLYRRRDYVFTYYLVNVITFSLALLLSQVPIELGFALGLFAVFSILRYRTEPILMRNLTYMFVVIGLGMLNALAHEQISLAELLVVNAVIVGMTAALELRPENRTQRTTSALYDNLALLRPGLKAELVQDVARRTGLDVVDVDLRRIDMLRDSAEITITYRVPGEHQG